MGRPARAVLRGLGYLGRPVNPALRAFMRPPELVEQHWRTARDLGPLDVGFVTDLHVGPTTPLAYVAAAMARLAARRPQVVLYGGDFLFRQPAGCEELGELLATVRPPQGAFAVLGNHDRWLDSARVERALTGAGVELLVNRGTRIQTPRGTIWLGGVDDLWTGRPDVRAALAGRALGEPAVVVTHNPDVAPEAARHGADLVLAGHTHGGQVRLFGRTPFSNSRHGATFAVGWARVGNADLYTSRGLGTVELSLRIGAPAEVTLLRIGAA